MDQKNILVVKHTLISSLLLFAISACGGSNKSGGNEPYAIDSIENTIVEENGVLKLRPTFTQADVTTGGNTVQVQIGHSFTGLNPNASDAKLSVEADLKIKSTVNSGNRYSTIRNSILINDGVDQFLIGLGIAHSLRDINGDGSKEGSYSLTAYVQRNNPLTQRPTKIYKRSFDVRDNVGNGYTPLVLEVNKSYKFKLEYAVNENTVIGYMDGLRVVQWEFPAHDRQNDDEANPVTVKAIILSRTASQVDEVLGEGEFIDSEADNLSIIYDNEVLVSDDFNDNSLVNSQINLSEKKVYQYSDDYNTHEFTTELLTQNDWFFVKNGIEGGSIDECLGKMVFNLNGSVSRLSYNDLSNTFITESLEYTISQYYEGGSGPFGRLEIEGVADVDFTGSTSTNFAVDGYINYDFSTGVFFTSRARAIEYAEGLGITDCSNMMPQ